jgi:hypothetical protein
MPFSVCTCISRAAAQLLVPTSRPYQVQSMTLAYRTLLKEPLDSDLVADNSTLPTDGVVQRGRTRKNRLRSRGEGAGGRTAKPYHCGRCGRPGHTVKTCTS